MRTVGIVEGYLQTSKGLMLNLFIDDDSENVEAVEKLKDRKLTVELKRFREGRSLNANAYFWKLCDGIAKVLGTTKDVIYLMMLKDFGTFETVEVRDDAKPILERYFRLTEEDYTFVRYNVEVDEFEYFTALRCYKGSHEYNTEEMSRLIDGAVQQAIDLGVPTYPQEEVDRMVSEWKGKDVDYGS